MRKTAIFFLTVFFAAGANADTIYLKNGGVVEGIVEKEDESKIEVNMGFGSVTFQRKQVKNVERLSPYDNGKTIKKWEEKKKELDAKAKEFEDAREKRFSEAYKNWMEEEGRKKLATEAGPKDVQITRDEGVNSIVVQVLLNEKVKANLVLDTGASLVVLSKRMGQELGIDIENTVNNKDTLVLKLADGRTTRARAVMLESIKIQDIEVKKVMAAVMLDQLTDPGLKDGLLGMSFLSKFNLRMDLKTMKMSLEKIGDEKE